MLIVKEYPEHNYKTLFSQSNGLFIRIPYKGFSDPMWSPNGPELIDFAITNKCTGKYGDGSVCSFCYRNSSPHGMHIELAQFHEVLNSISKFGTVNTIALGGGNPVLHPDFIEILSSIRKADIIPTFTYNGFGMTNDIRDATSKFCGAIAISYYGDFDLLNEEIKLSNIKTNIHWILSAHNIDEAIHWLKNDIAPDKINAIVFLTWKAIGRATNSGELHKNDDRIDEFLNLVFNKEHKHKIGFDSCFTTALVDRINDLEKIFIDGCEAGCFSMFIDEKLNASPCSFMTEKLPFSLDNPLTTWSNSELFVECRRYLLNKKCNCKHYLLCKNGCPQTTKNFCRRRV